MKKLIKLGLIIPGALVYIALKLTYDYS